jgi:hypothetical protein
MLDISDAAESIGFRTRGYRLTWEQLRDEVSPCGMQVISERSEDPDQSVGGSTGQSPGTLAEKLSRRRP